LVNQTGNWERFDEKARLERDGVLEKRDTQVEPTHASILKDANRIDELWLLV
jgi:hypothetical protein